MSENTIEVQPLASDEAGFASETLAVVADESIDLDVLADVVPSGRFFAEGSEPVADGVTYTSLDGRSFHRPSWRIADRGPGMVAGPDVWFGRDDEGTIGLRFTLVDVPPAGAPPDTWSLVIGVDEVKIVWNGGSRSFGRPPRIVPEPGDSRSLVPVATQLLPDEARTLELAMSDAASGCRLEVTSTVFYIVQHPEQEARPPRIIMFSDHYSDIADEFKAYGFDTTFVDIEGEGWWAIGVDESDVDRADELLEERGMPGGWTPTDTLATWQSYLREAFGEDKFLELAGSVPPSQSDHYEPVTQSIPFVFNPNDDAYRPIYRALHGAANLTNEWQKSAAGWLRASPFPNTVYRIPDEVRLAFDPDMGTPHVVTTLHADAQGRSSVRVLLRVAPWQDPRKVVEARALTGSESAKVIVGPVRSATLRLGGSFPEGVRIIGEAGSVAFSLSEGADLLMDLSLEYFQLLCDMLGGTVGLPGEVEVRLDDDTVATVPVSLRMDKVNDLPVGVEPLADGGRPPGPGRETQPTAVRVTNRARTPIRVGGCAAAFVRLDGASVVPMATYPARCTTTFPIELGDGGVQDLAFTAVDPREDHRWNAVLVELLDKSMVADARATLLKAQQLAGSGELTWDLTISSPVFTAAAMPERWANLASIEVEVSAPGFETTAVVLRKDTPARTLTMRKPLAALVAGGGAGIRTATYRIRNNYVDHQGQWTAPQQQSGEELVVFPNPAEGD
jgi:hypothetical protein